jgi:hypothetical protein
MTLSIRKLTQRKKRMKKERAGSMKISKEKVLEELESTLKFFIDSNTYVENTPLKQIRAEDYVQYETYRQVSNVLIGLIIRVERMVSDE